MLWPIILPIFRSTRLCVTACGIIINKLLFFHLVGCLYYLYPWCTVKQISDNEIYLLIKYTKSFLWRAAKHLSYTEDTWCLKVNNNQNTVQQVGSKYCICNIVTWRMYDIKFSLVFFDKTIFLLFPTDWL